MIVSWVLDILVLLEFAHRLQSFLDLHQRQKQALLSEWFVAFTKTTAQPIYSIAECSGVQALAGDKLYLRFACRSSFCHLLFLWWPDVAGLALRRGKASSSHWFSALHHHSRCQHPATCLQKKMAHTSRWPFDLGYTEWLMLEQDWVSASWVSGSIKNPTEEQVHRFDHETAGWNQNLFMLVFWAFQYFDGSMSLGMAVGVQNKTHTYVLVIYDCM